MNNNFSDKKNTDEEKKIAETNVDSASEKIAENESSSGNSNEITENEAESSDSNKNDASEKEALDESEQSETTETTSNSIEISEDKTQIHTLEARDLHKYFGRKKAVQGVNFKIHSGEVVGLLGPNGAGKTTSFYMVVGFHKPTSGQILLDGKNVTSLPMYKRAKAGISYLPQEPSVFKKLTVEENIWSILETRKDIDRKEKRKRLEELIEEFGIGHIRKQFAYTLSGGERRRTEIARSLAIEPKFLLLDEPFAGIDPIAVADIKGIIKILAKKNIGVLITDHNVRDTLEITSRAYIVSTGQILVEGDKEAIIQNEQAREIYLGENFHM